MTKADTTSVKGVASTSLPARLAQIEDKLNHLLASQSFYDLAIRAITNPHFEELDEFSNPRWQLGLCLQQQWLHDQGQVIINDLQTLRQRLNE